MKWYDLKDYYVYPGRVTGFESFTLMEPYYQKRGGAKTVAVNRVTPNIEYFREHDTVRYGEGDRTMLVYFTFDDSYMFSIDEKIKVLEAKEDETQTRPLTFFHYWLYVNELIVIFLIAFVIWGAQKVYLNKKP